MSAIDDDRDDAATGDPITVVLVDDHAMVRHGLQQLLSADDGVEVVGTARDGAEAVDVVARHRPRVVMMDLQMPGLDGVEATRRIVAAAQELGDSVQVVVLTSFSDRERIVAALDAGAIGYLLKDAEPQDLLDGIRAAARGDSPLHPRAARELLEARSSTARPAPPGIELTPREAEVLALVRQGLANKQIARRLGISERTVKAHLTSTFQRIGVVDRTQAALWAERNGVPPG
jgi:DNA-binding NarL/FixJ family response regulator